MEPVTRFVKETAEGPEGEAAPGAVPRRLTGWETIVFELGDERAAAPRPEGEDE